MPVSRKFIALLVLLHGSALSLVAASAIDVYGLSGPTLPWPPVQDFFSFIAPRLAIVESGFAVAVTGALLALPPIARRSTPRFWIWTSAAGLVLTLPMILGQNPALGTMRMAVKFGLFSVYPVLLAAAYYAMIRIMLARGWLICASSGVCDGCNYILAAGATSRCPECGREWPSR